MRPLLAAVLATLLLSAPLAAASVPPPGLTGSLSVVSSTPTTVTLHAEQTGGAPVTLSLTHYCYEDDAYGGQQKVRVQGAGDFTFNTGPRTYHGKLVTPTDCWALLEFYYSSARVLILDLQDTL